MSVTDDPQGELDTALARESDLRAALVEAHRQRLETEDRLAGRIDAALVEVEALRDQLAQAQRQALAEKVRRERLEQALGLDALRRLVDRSPLRALRARRARGFERELSRARGEDG